jgi:hypothetical protein
MSVSHVFDTEFQVERQILKTKENKEEKPYPFLMLAGVKTSLQLLTVHELCAFIGM